MKIRNYKKSDWQAVAHLIYKTYAKFNKDEGTVAGRKRYLDFYNIKKNGEKIKENFNKSSIFLVAEENNKIIGMIRGGLKKITNLFVLGKYQRRGLGKALVERFERRVKKSGLRELKVNASKYATLFYQKMGYKKTKGPFLWKGIYHQPMKKVL